MVELKVFFMFLSVLISVAFFTLFERKALGVYQNRKGPVKAIFLGLGQPFADALKLFSKESTFPKLTQLRFYSAAPVLHLTLVLGLWVGLPSYLGGPNFELSLLLILCIFSGGVFPLLLSGWGSKSSFSSLGGLRGLAQVLSYEVTLIFVFTLPACIMGSLKFENVFLLQSSLPFFLFSFPVGVLLFICSLAELGRSPFDFPEGESELVSGFNTEYGGGLFTLIFLAEYGSTIFLSMVMGWMYFSTQNTVFSPLVSGVALCSVYVWLRGSFPRYRYDKLMGLTWKSILSMSLGLFFLFLALKSSLLLG